MEHGHLTDGAARAYDAIAGQLGRICSALRRIAGAGRLMALLVWASLLPWLWRLASPWGVLLGVALGLLPVWAAWSLRRHARDLEEVYGGSDVLRAELTALGEGAGEVQRRLASLQDPPKGRFARIRWGAGYLRGLSSIWSELGVGDQVQRLVEPVDPTRLAASTWKALGLATTVVVGPVVIILSLVAWAVVG